MILVRTCAGTPCTLPKRSQTPKDIGLRLKDPTIHMRTSGNDTLRFNKGFNKKFVIKGVINPTNSQG